LTGSSKGKDFGMSGGICVSFFAIGCFGERISSAIDNYGTDRNISRLSRFVG
jgi:hypothetical protein